MGRSLAFALNERRCIRTDTLHLVNGGVMIWTNHHRQRTTISTWGGTENMGEQRTAGHRMQNLGQR
jgi:hypothetical protein